MATWANIKAEIEAEMDVQDELFVTADEILDYANDAVREAEQEIHALPGADKYFLTSGNLSLVSGTATVSLPADIYANKIVGIFYDNGSLKYEIKRLKDLRKILDVQDNQHYLYILTNSAASGTQIKLYPTPSETTATYVTIWYIRNAIEFADDNTELDIPEAKNFIKQYVKDKILNKERMSTDAPESPALARQRQLLVDTLTNMTPDENNEVTTSETPLNDQVSFWEE